MKVRVWLKGHEDDSREIKLRGLLMDPITPMNVRDYLCRTGIYSWADYQKIRYTGLKEPWFFTKKTKGWTYVILNMHSYERFFVGKKPSTRDIFEEWLKDPDVSMRSVSFRNGKKSSSLLERISRELKRQGVMRWEK